MSDFKFVMLANLTIVCVFIVCITSAAMHFDRLGVCWWYLLTPFLMLPYGEDEEQDDV